MCGIFGWDLNKSVITPTRRVILAAFLADKNDNRGGDSYGFYNFKEITKGLGDAGPAIHEVALSSRFFGHTRKKTTGEVIAANSHPFHIGSLIGCHNGMIHNHDEIAKKYKRDFAVDSMHIFAHLDEGKDLKELEGYGTICYVDTRKPNRLYLCKMHNGELSIFGVGKDTDAVKGIVFSSSKADAEKAMDMAGINDRFAYKVDEGVLFYVEGGCLYKAESKPVSVSPSSWSSGGRTNRYGWVEGEFDYPQHRTSGQTDRNYVTSEEWKKEQAALGAFRKLWTEALANGSYPTVKEWYDFTQYERNAFTDIMDKAEKALVLKGVMMEHETTDKSSPSTKGTGGGVIVNNQGNTPLPSNTVRNEVHLKPDEKPGQGQARYYNAQGQETDKQGRVLMPATTVEMLNAAEKSNVIQLPH
jgi:hypothetical protein